MPSYNANHDGIITEVIVDGNTYTIDFSNVDFSNLDTVVREVVNSWESDDDPDFEYEEFDTTERSELPHLTPQDVEEMTPMPECILWHQNNQYATINWYFSDRLGIDQFARLPRKWDHPEATEWEKAGRNFQVYIFSEVKKWADENDVTVLSGNISGNYFTGYEHIGCGVIRTPNEFYFWKNEPDNPDLSSSKMQELYQDNICRHCETENGPFALVCKECENPMFCQSCRRYTPTAIFSHHFGRCFCDRCGNSCEECGNHTSPALTFCEDCEEIQSCNICRDIYTTDNDRCNRCMDHTCESCGECDYETVSPVNGQSICRNCQIRDFGDEAFDVDSEMQATNMILERIPGRENIRLCGVELEGGNVWDPNRLHVGEELAAELYDLGISSTNRVQGYHHGNNGFAHIERDSSVDWEMVIGPINMASVSQVRQLNKCVKIIRKAIKENRAKLDMRCGTHIHVAADRVGLQQAYNLHILFAYIEDVMYRLGAAHWKMHRAIASSDHYCQKASKQDSLMAFAHEYEGNRYYGLSFSNYFSRMIGSCECGARRYGAWEECTCSLNKCTFEFRLFNATANPKKLFAYLALTQALVAKAIALPAIKNTDEYPAHNFVETVFKDMNSMMQDEMKSKWISRVNWIMNELPLTDEEKQALMYVLENSELSVIADEINIEGSN